MERFFWICLAGAAGAGARYLIALWAAQRFGSAFPYGTLLVNLIGCFTIAALMHSALTLGWSSTVRRHDDRLPRRPYDVLQLQLRNNATVQRGCAGSGCMRSLTPTLSHTRTLTIRLTPL
jgi:hypothetical protein